MREMSLRSCSQHSLALGGTLCQSGQLVRLWCGSDAGQKQKPCTLGSIHPTRLLSIEADTRRVCLSFFSLFFFSCSFGLGLCDVFFYGIVMATCIFLMSCIAEERIPVGEWRCLFFLISMSFGTTCYNDFT